jgi:hypothetical protein
MAYPDAQQVFMMSDYLGKLANLVGEYIDFNKGNLSAEDRNKLYDAEIELARSAGEMNIIGVNLAIDNIQTLLSELEEITAGVKQTVKKALAVQEAIKIAAGLVALGTAILSNDPQAILKTTAGLAKSLNLKL